MNHILTLDIGTTAIKTALFDRDLTLLKVDLEEYPEEEVEEAIKNCPCDCIAWEEV